MTHFYSRLWRPDKPEDLRSALRSLQEHATFRGNISSKLEGGEDPSKRMQRSGFAGFNTEVGLGKHARPCFVGSHAALGWDI